MPRFSRFVGFQGHRLPKEAFPLIPPKHQARQVFTKEEIQRMQDEYAPQGRFVRNTQLDNWTPRGRKKVK